MISVKGIIVPASWDQKGNVVEVAIATQDEEEYLIADRNQVAKLKRLLRQEVEIDGIIKTRAGKKVIKVKKFNKRKMDNVYDPYSVGNYHYTQHKEGYK